MIQIKINVNFSLLCNENQLKIFWYLFIISLKIIQWKKTRIEKYVKLCYLT